MEIIIDQNTKDVLIWAGMLFLGVLIILAVDEFLECSRTKKDLCAHKKAMARYIEKK